MKCDYEKDCRLRKLYGCEIVECKDYQLQQQVKLRRTRFYSIAKRAPAFFQERLGAIIDSIRGA